MPRFDDDLFFSIAEIEEFFNYLSTARNSLPKPYFKEEIWQPDIDVYETANEIVIIVDLCGVKKEEIDVTIEGDEVIIQGERKPIKLHEKYIFHQLELNFGKFRRVIKLPTKCLAHKTKAKYKDGVLKIVLPKG